MNANRYFSFSRLGLVMKRDFMENWKTNLYLFLGVFFAFLGVYLLQMYDYNDSIHGGVLDAYQTVECYVSHHTAAFAGVTSFLLVYFASETMRNMRTKEQRLSYLMLPATKLEKFVSRALFVTVGIFVMILLASLLAEAVHWAFMPFFENLPDKFKICVWPEVWDEIWEMISPFKTRKVILAPLDYNNLPETLPWVEKSMFFEFMLAYLVAFWFHSLYILGGNYFGKYAFFKTSGMLILIGVVVGYILSNINPKEYFDWFEEFVRMNEHWLTEDVAVGVTGFIVFCFIVLNWWLSYKLFTRQQVIKPKFRLL
jgi:hypothetical protein